MGRMLPVADQTAGYEDRIDAVGKVRRDAEAGVWVTRPIVRNLVMHKSMIMTFLLP